MVFAIPDFDCLSLRALTAEDYIIFVETLDSVYPNSCDEIAKEIWSTPTFNAPSLKGDLKATPLKSKPLKAKRKRQVTNPPPLKVSTSAVVTSCLRDWISQFKTPYTTRLERKCIARVLGVTHIQVSNFCNNHRKRYQKSGSTTVSCTQASGNVC
ncbi:hypothetical protein T484DRAFT_1757509 [Baffinella frigidus]|nr:hypothetical protein T484DRAFT_1757509 [Cryptophyta sp. CCMP2293]